MSKGALDRTHVGISLAERKMKAQSVEIATFLGQYSLHGGKIGIVGREGFQHRQIAPGDHEIRLQNDRALVGRRRFFGMAEFRLDHGGSDVESDFARF